MPEDESLTLLSVIAESGEPAGAYYLSGRLQTPQATVGRRLRQLEAEGYLQKVSNQGRVLTRKGERYLREQTKLAARSRSVFRLTDLIGSASRKTLMEVLEIRKRLEEMAVVLACGRISADEEDELSAIAEAYAVEIETGGPGSGLDLKLHLAIAKSSGNETLFELIKTLLETDDAYVKFHSISEAVKSRQESVRQHRAIVEAVISRDAARAGSLMLEHLEKVREDLSRYFDQGTSAG